ncbi:hypothetical protein [Sinorhizobium sojae]|uniref:hypothetical protein n=1 Tax=Sinorhizobium sojae TaxID=716925 RepID=UPI000551EF7A|nr:hypothetical protein [Sinorhizobium sojae]
MAAAVSANRKLYCGTGAAVRKGEKAQCRSTIRADADQLAIWSRPFSKTARAVEGAEGPEESHPDQLLVFRGFVRLLVQPKDR